MPDQDYECPHCDSQILLQGDPGLYDCPECGREIHLISCPHCQETNITNDENGTFVCQGEDCGKDFDAISCPHCQETNITNGENGTFECIACGHDFDVEGDEDHEDHSDFVEVDSIRDEIQELRTTVDDLRTELRRLKESTKASADKNIKTITEAVKKEIEHLKDLNSYLQASPSGQPTEK